MWGGGSKAARSAALGTLRIGAMGIVQMGLASDLLAQLSLLDSLCIMVDDTAKSSAGGAC